LLVGDLHVGGHLVEYRTFVAPGTDRDRGDERVGLLDTTFNFFVKMKYSHTYDGCARVSTDPARDVAVGEITWALLRGSGLFAAFLLRCSRSANLRSWWSCWRCRRVLIGFGFAGVGLAATTFMRSFVDFDYVEHAMIQLFSSRPRSSRYARTNPGRTAGGDPLTPLYQGVVAGDVSFVIGDLHWTLLANAALSRGPWA